MLGSLQEEAGACVADAGTVHPDDGGVASVVEGLAIWTTSFVGSSTHNET